MEKPYVVGVCGSLRDSSYTRKALEIALDAAEKEGAETELIDLRSYDLPVFDADEDDPGDSAELKRKVREADSLLLGTPVYHGSYSSALKNALDYCGFDEFEDTTVGLLATAGGGSYASTLDHLRTVSRTLHAWVLPLQVGIRNAYEKFEDGELEDDDLRERTEKLGREAVKYSRITPDKYTETTACADD